MTNEMTLSYQTRLSLNEEGIVILSEYADLFNTVEHSLYAEVAKGQRSASCKNEFLKKYEITARQFNACRVTLEGKIAACRAGQEQAVINLKQKIETLTEQIKRLEKKPSKRFALHQKKRRKNHLFQRLSALEKDRKKKKVALCFGGKQLFRAQFHLEKNGFASHPEWKKRWEEKRKSEFFVLGSKDETAGNQTCTATIQEDGRLTLRLRLPQALKRGKYLEIRDVSFAYGHEAILASLNHPEGQALSYRFKKDDKGFRVFVSTTLEKADLVSNEGRGAIGIDLNTDHIAYIETDRFGNPVHKKVIPWNSYGKTREQLKALTGDICKQIIDYAREVKKPIVLEKLDFKNKKLAL
jgi:hypothetical protein